MAYCKWDKISERYKCYHDEEWGVPLHDDRMQFEFLMIEAMQCGLSWRIILQKREIFRKYFNNFDYEKNTRYDESDISRIMSTDGMIKSRGKAEAVCRLRLICGREGRGAVRTCRRRGLQRRADTRHHHGQG